MTNIPTSDPAGLYFEHSRPDQGVERFVQDAPRAVAHVPGLAQVVQGWYAVSYAYKRHLETTAMGREARRAYGARVSRYTSFASAYYNGDFPPAPLHLGIVEDFVKHLESELGLAESSINCTITTLRHFYQFVGIDISSIPKRIVVAAGVSVLNSDNIRNLADVVSKRSKRDQAIIHLFLLAGLRTRELVNLNVRDFKTDARGVCSLSIITGETGNRILTLAPSFASVIEAYIQTRFGANEEAMFVTKNGQRMTTTAINYIVRSVGWAARIELSPGILRDTFLYHQLSQRQSLREVAYVGGYSRLSSLKRHIGLKPRKKQVQ